MPLKVESRHGAYPILIHNCHHQDHFQQLLRRHPNSPFAVITDTHLYNLYPETIATLKKIKRNPRVEVFTIPPGEKSKNIHTKMLLEKSLFTNGFDRNGILIAWGGGVIGDLVGYLAATYMRGITYYAFPSSVIAMVDSSVGGKTGIDTPYGKNLIGSLYPPQGVFIDVNLLTTLPQREFINGCAEIAKYHFITNGKIGEIIQNSEKNFHPNNKSLMTKLIEESLKVKIEVVAQDESEAGLRRILNFGHTVGHALEHHSRYRISHGYAVAIGMGVEAFWALRKKSISSKQFEEIISLLALLKLPTALPKSYRTEAVHRELYNLCLKDKKSQNQDVYFVCLQGRRKWKVKSNRGQYREPITKKEFMASMREYSSTFS